MLANFFSKDKAYVGIVAALCSQLGFCVALALALLIAKEPIAEHIRWFGGMFVPPILLLHHYTKHGTMLHVIRAIIVVLFVTFIAFMAYLLSAKIIVLQ